jgi:peptide/nickel transport system ATP-binding protein
MSFTCKHLYIKNSSDVLVDIGFEIKHSLALVGQSGSGKSLTLKALLGLVPQSLHVKIEYDAPFPLIRGKNVAFVPQNPFTALSPLTSIKNQFFHKDAEKYMDEVELNASLLERFPPELSGGQLQRVVIAMALASRPQLVLLDEPTTALDAPTRVKVLTMLCALQQKLGFLILLVTHDMRAAAQVCKEIAILHSGKIVEFGHMDTILKSPSHSYTQALLDSGFAHRGFRQ